MKLTFQRFRRDIWKTSIQSSSGCGACLVALISLKNWSGGDVQAITVSLPTSTKKIGRLLEALEETGQLDNTVIVYN